MGCIDDMPPITLSRCGLPVGCLMLWLQDALPAGWLSCNGQAVSRTTYASLFAVAGTAYGAGDGSTTFNLPDLRSRVPVGCDARDTRFSTQGATGGSSTATLTAANLPAHQHGTNATATSAGAHYHNGGTTSTAGGHTHTYPAPYMTTGNIWGAGWSDGGTLWRTGTQDSATDHAPAHSHGCATSAAADHTHASFNTDNGPGTSQALNVTNPFITVAYIIRAA